MSRHGASGSATGAPRSRGFDLIQLMIVLLIISILTLLAISAYLEYTVRAKVSEALRFVGPVRTNLYEYYASQGEWPQNNEQAGLYAPEEYRSRYVTRLEVGVPGQPPGSFVVTLRSRTIPALGSNNTILFVPVTGAGGVSWDCSGGTVPDVYRPGICVKE